MLRPWQTNTWMVTFHSCLTIMSVQLFISLYWRAPCTVEWAKPDLPNSFQGHFPFVCSSVYMFVCLYLFVPMSMCLSVCQCILGRPQCQYRSCQMFLGLNRILRFLVQGRTRDPRHDPTTRRSSGRWPVGSTLRPELPPTGATGPRQHRRWVLKLT